MLGGTLFLGSRLSGLRLVASHGGRFAWGVRPSHVSRPSFPAAAEPVADLPPSSGSSVISPRTTGCPPPRLDTDAAAVLRPRRCSLLACCGPTAHAHPHCLRVRCWFCETILHAPVLRGLDRPSSDQGMEAQEWRLTLPPLATPTAATTYCAASSLPRVLHGCLLDPAAALTMKNATIRCLFTLAF